jgi:hypothetical protein
MRVEHRTPAVYDPRSDVAAEFHLGRERGEVKNRSCAPTASRGSGPTTQRGNVANVSGPGGVGYGGCHSVGVGGRRKKALGAGGCPTLNTVYFFPPSSRFSVPRIVAD